MTKWRGLAGLLLAMALLVGTCSGPGEAVPQGMEEGSQARDFSLHDLADEEVSLSDYQGKVVLINFWATWCPPCRAEIPDLEAAYREHQDDDFVVLGISIEDPPEAVRAFVDEYGVTYPVLLDSEGKMVSIYRAAGLPTSVFVDPRGVIRVRHVGYLSDAQMDQYLQSLLP